MNNVRQMHPRRDPNEVETKFSTSFYRKILSVVTSASLILTLVPAGPAYAAENERWSDTIDAMLASGECAEGEAIVALLGDEDDALIAQASLLVDEIEPLMEVSAEAAGVAAGKGLAAQSE